MSIFNPLSAGKGNTFYSRLAKGECGNYIWGKGKRFSPERTIASPSIAKYFTAKVRPYIRPESKVLDIGCGSGVFLPIIAGMSEDVTGIDLSPDLLADCSASLERFGISNVTLLNASCSELPFADNQFDVLTVVDVIHHVDQLTYSLNEIQRVIKPGGKALVFEPNKYNVLLALLCLLDRNEWGALQLGSKSKYNRLFSSYFQIDVMEYNGLLIGPDSKLNRAVANFLTWPVVKTLLGWQSPKIFMVLTKP